MWVIIRLGISCFMVCAMGIAQLAVAQSSDPSKPFPVFKVDYKTYREYEGKENPGGEQVGFSSLVDHRGLFLSVAHVFNTVTDNEGNTEKFYVMYRSQPLWLEKIFSVNITGTTLLANDGPILLYPTIKGKEEEKFAPVVFDGYKKAFPYYMSFSLSGKDAKNEVQLEYVEKGANGSEQSFSGQVSQSFETQETSMEVCKKLSVIGLKNTIHKGQSGSPVLDDDGRISGLVAAKGGDNSTEAIFIPSECILQLFAQEYYKQLRFPLATLGVDWRVDEITQRNNYNHSIQYYLSEDEISIFDWLQLQSVSADKINLPNGNIISEIIDKLFPIGGKTENQQVYNLNENVLQNNMTNSIIDGSRSLYSFIYNNYCENLSKAVQVDESDPLKLSIGESEFLRNNVLKFEFTPDCDKFILVSIVDNGNNISEMDSLLTSVKAYTMAAIGGTNGSEVRSKARNFFTSERYGEATKMEINLTLAVLAGYGAASQANLKYDRKNSYRLGRLVDLMDATGRLMFFYEEKGFPDPLLKSDFCGLMTALANEIIDQVAEDADYPEYYTKNSTATLSQFCSEGDISVAVSSSHISEMVAN